MELNIEAQKKMRAIISKGDMVKFNKTIHKLLTNEGFTTDYVMDTKTWKEIIKDYHNRINGRSISCLLTNGDTLIIVE